MVFRPCTPNLLPAICRAMLRCQEQGILKGSGYYEFGVYAGFSLWFAEQFARILNEPEMVFFGFDSFQGLPEVSGVDAGGRFRRGAYTCSYDQVAQFLAAHEADLSRIRLFPGFYSREHFRELSARHVFPLASVVVVDCDLYASTVPVLEFVGPMLWDEAVVIFDDYNCFNRDDNRGGAAGFPGVPQRAPQAHHRALRGLRLARP